ncbi:TetR/AcrR family transcriptional regulator [Streptomyces sp. MNU76]|nr:TetR/AcrR family transcriptional regulator [Streptomyces sp. MNU76]MCC9709721.1 TetR/AcrR family transcriptional regulator [Streptomyces sp. MNU76]
MSAATRTKLLEGALRTLVEQGIAKTSARSIAATAGVNQALVFYHFGSVDELLAEACRYGAEQRVARHRERMAAIGSLSELLAFGREMHVEERAAGHVAVLGQLLAGADASSAGAGDRGGLDLWIAEVEGCCGGCSRVAARGVRRCAGLARAVASSLWGWSCTRGLIRRGGEALGALEQLAGVVTALDGLGPVAQRAVRHQLRKVAGR